MASLFKFNIYPYPLTNLSVSLNGTPIPSPYFNDLGTYYRFETDDMGTYTFSADGYDSDQATVSYDDPGTIIDITLTATTNYVSKLANGGNTYIIKDAEARASISSLATVATTGAYSDLSGTPTIPIVDQTYDATSTNAQAGIAVASGISNAVSGKVDKVTTVKKLYGTDASGNQTTISYVSDANTASTIVQRDANSQINVAQTPTANTHATSKKYVDDGLGAINGKIPSAATTTNQLADKAFVNSTVQTNTANFRGNWGTWALVPTSASDYPADYTGSTTPTVNDYMVVQDASDYSAASYYCWKNTYDDTYYTLSPTPAAGDNLYEKVDGQFVIPGALTLDSVDVDYSYIRTSLASATRSKCARYSAGDESTSLDGTWRFKYSGTWLTDGKSGWLPEYQVNETPFTQAQIDAINSGITSSLVTTFGNKQDAITGAATTITSSNLTTNRALVSNNSGKVAVSSVTSVELGYVSGVTSAIQTQLNNKANDNGVVHTTGNESISGTKTFNDTLELKNNLSFRSYGTNNSGRLQFRAQPSDNVIRGTMAITDGYSTSGSGYNGFVAQMVARSGSTSSDPFNTVRVSNKGIEYIKEANDGTIIGQYIIVNDSGIVPSDRLATSGTTGQVLTKTASGQSWQTIDALPSQSGQSGKYLTTNGTTASWANVPTEIPSQSGNSGKFLTTNGTTTSWDNVPTEIPAQSGNSGKFLTTNGTAVSWATVDALPSQTGNAGKFLTTNGTDASWTTIASYDSANKRLVLS